MGDFAQSIGPEILLKTHHIVFVGGDRDAEFFEGLQRGLELGIEVAVGHVQRGQVGVRTQPVFADDGGSKIPLVPEDKGKTGRIDVGIVTQNVGLLIKTRDDRAFGQTNVCRNIFEHSDGLDPVAPQAQRIILFGLLGSFLAYRLGTRGSLGLGVLGFGIFGFAALGFGILGLGPRCGRDGILERLIGKDLAQKSPFVVQRIHGDVGVDPLCSGILNCISQIDCGQWGGNPLIIRLVLVSDVHEVHQGQFVDGHLVIGAHGMRKAGWPSTVAQIVKNSIPFGFGIQEPERLVNSCSRRGIVFQA